MKPRCSDLAERLSYIDDLESIRVLRESLKCLVVAVHDMGGCDALDNVMKKAKRIRDHREAEGVTSI